MNDPKNEADAKEDKKIKEEGKTPFTGDVKKGDYPSNTTQRW